MNRHIQQRRRRLADQPRVGDTIIVQERGTRARRVTVQRVRPLGWGAPGTLALTVRVQFLRAPGLWSWGGYQQTLFAGHWWQSWPQLVRCAQTTEEG